MEWLKDLKKEELPENYQEMLTVLVGAVGDDLKALRAIIDLAKYYNKQPFYFSGIDAIVSRRKREFIIKNRGRMRVSDLARTTQLSQQSIYDIFEELQKSKPRDLFIKGDEDDTGPAKCVR